MISLDILLGNMDLQFEALSKQLDEISIINKQKYDELIALGKRIDEALEKLSCLA